MKKFLLSIVSCVLAVFGSGCTTIGWITGKSPEELHSEAVAKLCEYAEVRAHAKIDQSEKFPPEMKEYLKQEVTRLTEELMVKIDALHDKVIAAQSAQEQ